MLLKLDLNERQIKAIEFLKVNSKITNKQYQELNNVTKKTATRDLKTLTDLELIHSSGKAGAGAFYVLN